MSPLDSDIACLCQSIEINNNRHVYRQSQVRMPTGSGVEWAECSLIIRTGCRVQVLSLILDSSVGLSAGIQSAGDSVPETLWFRILHSAEEDNLSHLYICSVGLAVRIQSTGDSVPETLGSSQSCIQ